MYTLASRLLLSVALIFPVAVHSTMQCSENTVVHERCFTLGQTMADLAARMAVDYVKIGGTDKAKQEHLTDLWILEILKGAETEIDNALSTADANFTPEQVSILKARVTEDKKSVQEMVATVALAKGANSEGIATNNKEEKSAEIAYAFGTTLAQVYWLLNTTGLTLANTDKSKAMETAKNLVLRLIAGITTQLKDCTQKEFLERYQLSKEREQEYTKLTNTMKVMIDSAWDTFLAKFGQTA